MVLLACTGLLSSCAVDANELAVKDKANSSSAIFLKLAPLLDLDGKSKTEILALRCEAVSQYENLLARPYQPSSDVFGQILDGKSWWGMQGTYIWGCGERSYEGASEESRFILNPFLLVAANPWTAEEWQPDRIESEKIATDELPFTWLPEKIEFDASQAKLHVYYDVSKFNQSLDPYSHLLKNNYKTCRKFSLVAYNARDFGYNYLALDRNSRNIDIGPSQGKTIRINQFIHHGHSCGTAEGCNNMSPWNASLDQIAFDELPAAARLFLWKKKPMDSGKNPDFTVELDFY